MAVFLFENDSLQEIPTTTFSKEGILERKHLQAAIKKNVAIVAPNCLVIAEEFSEWLDSQRRIDLLALDRNAELVVIELKRSESGEHMELQAIRYAAMVSTLTFKRTVEIYQAFLERDGIAGNAEQNILEFLGWEEPQEEDFALNTRIVLVSQDFSKELTTAVMWLNERGLEIRCVRLTPYKNATQTLIDVQQIIPLPEVEAYQVRIREQTEERREARKSAKDHTKYLFAGETYNKRKLALAVVKAWYIANRPQSIHELQSAFPPDLKSGGLFCEASEAQKNYER
jgi:RecB family endonuclease NucS